MRNPTAFNAGQAVIFLKNNSPSRAKAEQHRTAVLQAFVLRFPGYQARILCSHLYAGEFEDCDVVVYDEYLDTDKLRSSAKVRMTLKELFKSVAPARKRADTDPRDEIPEEDVVPETDEEREARANAQVDG